MSKKSTCTEECVPCGVCGETCHSVADGCKTVSAISGSAECAEFWNESEDKSAGVCHGECGFQAGLVLA